MRAVRIAIFTATVVLVGCALCPAWQAPLSYPPVYRAQKLPELPGANLVSTGRQTKSLRDGIRLQLTSPKPLAEVREFYREALTTSGWKTEESPAARAGQANPRGTMLTFTKDRLTYSVIITAPPQGAGTQVSINVVER